MIGPCKWTRIAALAALMPGALLANGPAPTGADIAAALTTHDVIYDGFGWERHLGNGRLVSRSVEAPFGQTSVGEWRMEGNTRCLRWSRAMGWACYRVEIEGETLRFVDELGNTVTGRLVPR